MALFRKLFYRKPPDGLLEICEHVYVFDCCFMMDSWQHRDYKGYIAGIVGQLKEHFPDASYLAFNFREGETQGQIADVLSEYDMTIMEYPRHYEGCPLLTMEVVHHFLRSGESWLSLGQQNLLLMHCERGGWPVLAFMLAALLIYRKQYSGEQKTLDMIYRQAPRELLQLLCPLNPVPSQLRYLQYVSRRNVATEWPPLDRALNLDCVIMRFIPNFDGEGGCRPLFRIYGQDPFLASDRTPKFLYSTPKKNKTYRSYKQAECQLVKIDIHCAIQGDVVLECVSIRDEMDSEEMMFRVVFNTAFIRSNILILNRDEIDMLWDAKDLFPKHFRAEIIFSEVDAHASVIPMDFTGLEEKDGLPVEAFAKVHEIFTNVDWSAPDADVAFSVLQQMQDMDLGYSAEQSPRSLDSSPRNYQERRKRMASDRLLRNSLLSWGSSDSVESTELSPLTRFLRDEQQNNENSPKETPQTPLDLTIRELLLEHASLKNAEVSLQQFLKNSLAQSFGHMDTSNSCSPTAIVGAEVQDSENNNRVSQSASSHGIQGADTRSSCDSSAPQLQPAIVSAAEKLRFFAQSSANSHTDGQKASVRITSPIAPPAPSLPSAFSSKSSEISFAPPPPPPPPPPAPHGTTPLFMSTTLPVPSAPPPPPIPSPTAISGSSFVPLSPPPALPTHSKSVPATPPPPPPPPAGHTHSSSVPAPPPPPPPPLVGNTHSNSVPAPPPPPPPACSSAPPPPPSCSSAPPPPPPPAPPPPPPSVNGNSRGRDSGPRSNVPPTPAPPMSNALGAKGRLSRSLKNNQKKLKPLHWLKLTRAVQGSLWAETQKSGEASKAPEIDISELESLFAAAAPNQDRGGKSHTSAPRPKSDIVQLIDHRRAYNCEIMLSKVKVPLNELTGYVLTLEDSTLDIDQVENLIKFCPTKEEMELLKGYTGDKEKLGKCEQFFLELMKVPRVESKLKVFAFKMQFRLQVSDLRKSLNTVNSASEQKCNHQIRNSTKLKRIMQTILSLGNALNQGTARGAAIGFRLDSLLKLTDTRARNNKMTLMHYLCKVLADKLPELLDFSKDMTSLEPSSKVQLKFLAEEMQAISKGLEKVMQELSSSENDGPVSESFCKTLKEFLRFAEAEVRSLASLYSGVGRNVDALILYFGEDPARCPFEQVCSTLLNFVRLFNKAHVENCKQHEIELKKAAENEKEKNKVAGNNSNPLLQTRVQTSSIK
ncbi:Formin-like protein 13 [Linum perenne]